MAEGRQHRWHASHQGGGEVFPQHTTGHQRTWHLHPHRPSGPAYQKSCLCMPAQNCLAQSCAGSGGRPAGHAGGAGGSAAGQSLPAVLTLCWAASSAIASSWAALCLCNTQPIELDRQKYQHWDHRTSSMQYLLTTAVSGATRSAAKDMAGCTECNTRSV